MVNAEIYISDFREDQENKLQSLARLTLCFLTVLGGCWLEHAVSFAEMCLSFPEVQMELGAQHSAHTVTPVQ